jgi:hypothetical protein
MFGCIRKMTIGSKMPAPQRLAHALDWCGLSESGRAGTPAAAIGWVLHPMLHDPNLGIVVG